MTTTQKQEKPAMRHLSAANMTVTVAIEEARKRGLMHRSDVRSMNANEYAQYVELCAREWGVTAWDES